MANDPLDEEQLEAEEGRWTESEAMRAVSDAVTAIRPQQCLLTQK